MFIAAQIHRMLPDVFETLGPATNTLTTHAAAEPFVA